VYYRPRVASFGRREWLAAVLGSAAAGRWLAGCEAGGRGTSPPPDLPGTLYEPARKRGHRLRDHPPGAARFQGIPPRRTAVVVVGGGIAGLAAAWRLRRKGLTAFEVLELEDEPGGTARGATAPPGGLPHPWGAHYVPLPFGDQPALVSLLREVGAVVGTDPEGDPIGDEARLVRDPKERLFHAGYWSEGLWLAPGAGAGDRAELARFQRTLAALVAARDGAGRRPFAIPVAQSSDDPRFADLDRMSATEWLDREGYRSRRLRWLIDYGCRDDYGVGADGASAWAALFYHAARVRRSGEGARPILAWPEGNAALAGHLAAAAGGDRVRTGRLVTDVVPDPEAGLVRVHALVGEDARPEVVLARRVIVALPRFIARRVAAPLRRDKGTAGGDYDPPYGPWVVANLHLRKRPGSRGFPLAWDNVLFDSPSLGYVVATHQTFRDHGPTVWTWYLPLSDTDPKAARDKVEDASLADWQAAVLADLAPAHVGLLALVEAIDVFRWGHGMVQARPGVVSDPARRAAAEPRDGVHFAHTDLSGVALFEEAFHHGVRAADEVLGGLGRGPTGASAS